MNFLFITTPQHDDHGLKVSASKVFDQRINENRWAIYESTRNKKQISENDKIVFYVSNLKSGGHLVGTATISKLQKPLRNQRFYSEHGIVDYYVLFKDIEMFEKTINFKNILENLSFCPLNKQKWGVVLMGGVRQLNDDDYNYIVAASAVAH